ncbi:hypothetical protein F5X99DRAFT_104657 [Biscogniauxia marginata]|nr:hypothetical protein F5X99DRAFT_104657 [Biscogniauxia marginata]
MKFVYPTIVLAAAVMATTDIASPIDPAIDASEQDYPPPIPYSGYATEVPYAVNDGTMSGLNISDTSYTLNNGTPFYEFKKTAPHHGIIPISSWQCTGTPLDAKDEKTVTDKVIAWGLRRTSILNRKSVAILSWRSVSWYFCNCLWWHNHHVPPAEIHEVVEFLAKNCGRHWSGWVYSHAWGKGYVLTPTKEIEHKPKWEMCPAGCIP